MKANKIEAQEILESIQERGLNMSGLSRQDFIQGVIANWGCSKVTANMVARMSGNW